MAESSNRQAAEARAHRVYDIVESYAVGNSIGQAISGFFGTFVSWTADGAALYLYLRMWNSIREVYGKDALGAGKAFEYIRPAIAIIIGDLVADKFLGDLPLIGAPVNFVLARITTWRLGVVFGMVSAISDDDAVIAQTVARLIPELFPAKGILGGIFQTPNRDVFIRAIASVDGITKEQVEERVEKILSGLEGSGE